MNKVTRAIALSALVLPLLATAQTGSEVKDAGKTRSDLQRNQDTVNAQTGKTGATNRPDDASSTGETTKSKKARSGVRNGTGSASTEPSTKTRPSDSPT